MTKRSFLLIAAFGLLASLAFTAPSHAGTVYTVDSTVYVLAGHATDVTETFSAAVSGPVTVTSTTLSVIGSPTVSGSNVTFNFASVGVGFYTLDYTLTGGPGLLGLGGTLSGTGAHQGGAAVLVTSVPEPTSVALLGIGMTGFLAFRRLFKRRAVV